MSPFWRVALPLDQLTTNCLGGIARRQKSVLKRIQYKNSHILGENRVK